LSQAQNILLIDLPSKTHLPCSRKVDYEMKKNAVILGAAISAFMSGPVQSQELPFGEYDLNDDGYLTTEEITSAFDLPVGMFEMLDGNQDNLVDRSEIMSFMAPAQ
jgi:hypothetical protein